ncbi:peptidylprolyl isomerase [Miltoncostaea marina]|uniref:peptidylprolyl isomerase n=1 Tax=Miltoncostaea marina TaxID=2843215 RepID=UPI001C3CCD5C|nr:peptidylprolyl isomerase [Miltoncostaea marina]
MTKTNRRSPLVAGVLVALVAVGVSGLLLLSGCGDDASADLPDGVVAQVGDAPITEGELTGLIEQQRAEYRSQGQTLPREGEDGWDSLRQQALQSLVTQKVVEFEARACGKPCEVSKAEVTKQLDRIIQTNFEGSQKKFRDFLKDRGMSQADVRGIVRNDLQREALYEHETRGVRFTADEARKYYDDNPSQFTTPAGRTARHIVVDTKAEADRIRAELTLDNFDELAREHSTDEGSAEQGGDLGQIQKGQLVPEFEEVAFALKDGEISQPVKTQFGWHIITVDITPKTTTSFAEARPQIMSQQLQAKRQTAFTEWSEEVMTKWLDRTVYADDALKPPATTAAQAATAP